jgi:hypothetical protein
MKNSRNHPLLSANNCLRAGSQYFGITSFSKIRTLCKIVQILNK